MNKPSVDPELEYPDERQDFSPYNKRQQLRRVLWWIGEFLLFKYSPRPVYAWRRFVLRLYGATLGDHVYVSRTAKIEFPWNLHMEHHSCIGDNSWIYNLAKVSIGECATISQSVTICTGTHDYTLPHLPQVTKPVTIERGAWIAMETFILPGVTIGKNAVIGARSLVTKDMPEAMVCAGHPCVPIKQRLPDTHAPSTK